MACREPKKGHSSTRDWKRARLSPTESAGSPKGEGPRRRGDTDEATTDSDAYDDEDHSTKEVSSHPSPPPTLPPAEPRNPEWAAQEPLDLHHHRNGVPSPAESPQAETQPFDLHKKKSPIDILARVFPRENRSILNVVLQRNGGDVLQAIDDLLSTKEPADAEKATNDTSSEAASPNASPLSPMASPRHPMADPSAMPGFTTPPNFFTSGHSPALTMGAGGLSFRRPYQAAPGTRGLLAVPTYSGFFPGIAPTFTPGYPNFFGPSLSSGTPPTAEEKKKDCWPTCNNSSPQDLSSPETKSPNGYAD
ncbi:doublesex- and mab-3-related transcription factor A2-like [Uloborus diversus]|uniref:doublesex- and mab-3-related transcription factor A2-like n=1 Tax=Uloborus diversus TaxID=327109 RepID=UPI002409C4D7|nr:doublesex- and mab-3-related transcription factor A2-like [Uloborus diversus]